jgi:hypothetical protein
MTQAATLACTAAAPRAVTRAPGRIRFVLSFQIVLAAVLFASIGWAGAGEHPRVFLDAERIAEIRQAITVDGSTHQRVWESLRRDVDRSESWWDPQSKNWNYGRAYLAQAAAFCYLVTGEKQYARQAWQTLKDIHDKPDPDRRLPERGYGLSRATVGMGFGVAYDWCHDAWTPEQRTYVMERILAALKAWPRYRHVNLGSQRGSNWVGVCRGGELVLLVAAGLEDSDAYAERYALLKRELKLHIRNGYDELGVTQEGIGYAGYGGIFLQRAILAARSVGDDDLAEAAADRAWWKQAMYAGTFSIGEGIREQPGERIFLMSGVGGPTIGDEGWASLMLGTCPSAQLPYYLWWYDRHAGIKSPGKLEQQFDARREGRIWTLIYYPEDLEAKDPTGIFPAAVKGASGMCLFRNRWHDANDICGYLMADTRHHGRAWDQPEALQIGLHAFGTLFFGGPNKTRDAANYSVLLVDGHAHRGRRGVQDGGELAGFEVDGPTATMTAGGGRQYANIGVDVRRQLRVDFRAGRADKNAAILSTLDRISSKESHTYTWQANLGDHQSDWKVKAVKGSEAGRPMFLLTTHGGGYVKGWVLAPVEAEAEVAVDDPLSISATGRDVDIWVVMAVGQGEPPVAETDGAGLQSTLRVRDMTVSWDAAAGSIVSRP